MYAARALPPAHAPRLPAHTSPGIVYALLSTRQTAKAFNQPLSFDTSSVTDMRYMFQVRSVHALARPAFTARPSRRACRSRRRRATAPRLLAHTSLRIVRPPFDSAVRNRPVRRQQAAHPLRVGGHLGLRLCWLRLDLGSGRLRVKIGCMCARD